MNERPAALLAAFACNLLLLAWSSGRYSDDVLTVERIDMKIIDNVRLDELLFELEYNGVTADFICTSCQGATQLKIVELHPLSYKIRCARCGGSTWGGRRYNLRWNVRGFDGAEEIYNRDIELDLDAIRSHLQDLARQGLVQRDRIRPELLEVRTNHETGRLSFVCGVDPHYVAITISQEE